MLDKIKNFFKKFTKTRITRKVRIQKEIMDFLNAKEKERPSILCNNNFTYLDKLMFDYNIANKLEGFSLRCELKETLPRKTQDRMDYTTAHLGISLIRSPKHRAIIADMSEKKKMQLRFLNDNLDLRETKLRLVNNNFNKEDFLFCFDSVGSENFDYVEYVDCSCEICSYLRENARKVNFFAV